MTRIFGDNIVILQQGTHSVLYCGWVIHKQTLEIYFYNCSGTTNEYSLLRRLSDESTRFYPESDMIGSITYSDELERYQKIRNRNKKIEHIIK